MAYKLTYQNKDKKRNQPLSPELVRAYERAALQAKIDEIRVMSGGQPSSGPNRTGSHRHDEGGAGDIQLVRGGRVLDFTNPDDLPYFRNFVSGAKGAGLTGFGAGIDYMGGDTIHAGAGSPAVWGARGLGTNAPGWLREAYGTTLNSNPVATASAAPIAPSTVGTGPFPDAPAAPQNQLVGGLQQIAKGLAGNKPPPPEEIRPASPAAQPAVPNPQAAQMLASLLQPPSRKRKNPLYGYGIV